MTVLDYTMMVEDSHVRTQTVEYRRRDPDSRFTGLGSGPLMAVGAVRRLHDWQDMRGGIRSDS